MKKGIILALMTLVWTVAGYSQEHHINFVEVELDSAYKIAKAENKLVFVDCFTTWCGPCKWMDANTFTDENVANYFNEHFINVKLDMEEGEGEVFAGWYEVRSYPTYIFLDVSGRRKELVHRAVGTKDAERFLQFAKDAMDTNVRIGEARKRYTNGDRDPEFIKKHIGSLYNAGYAADAREIAFWHYRKINWSEIDSVDADNLLRFVNGSSHPMYNEMMSNLASIEKVANSESLFSMLYRGISSPVWVGLRSDDPETPYNDVMKQLDALNYSQKEKLRSQIKLYYLAETDMDQYLEMAPNIVQTYFNDDSGMLNSVAWNLYESTKNKKALKSALMFVERSVELESNYNNLDTKMRLMYVLGKKKEAMIVAKDIEKLIEETPGLSSVKDTHAALMSAMKSGKDITEIK